MASHHVRATSLVWKFCLTLQWPAPLNPVLPTDASISWTELAVSFMLWAGRFLRIKISDGSLMIAVDYNDPGC